MSTQPSEQNSSGALVSTAAAAVLSVRVYSGSAFGTGTGNNRFGSTDPTDIAYNPVSRSFYVCDSEVDESPFFASKNLFRLDAQGRFQQGISLSSFSKEPTGLAIGPDSNTGATRLFVCDDVKQRIFVVDPASPTKVLKSFSTLSFNCTDPEDLDFNPTNGHLFVLSENNRRILEVTQDGSLVKSIQLPTSIATPEGLAYDAANNRFYVSTGASPDIFVVSATGVIVETVTVLRDYPNPVGGIRVVPKGLDLAPSSDGSGRLSLWVTDYGKDQKADGRIFEIKLDQSAQGATTLALSSAADTELGAALAPEISEDSWAPSVHAIAMQNLDPDGPFLHGLMASHLPGDHPLDYLL